MDSPYIVEETENYAVVFKPAKMHSMPQKEEEFYHEPHEQHEQEEEQKTIFHWFQEQKSFNNDIKLMHRLDYETNGLVLFAKNEKSFLFFKDLQDRGDFIKEYSAICEPANSSVVIEGFPNYSSAPQRLCEKKFTIESYFRPYGPGRKQVRPIVDIPKKHKEIAKDKGGFYQTEIIDIKDSDKTKIFTVRIKRGFRHQIRCHLCWIGFPILNDPLYSLADVQPEALLALRSHALFFADPASGERRECRIEGLVTVTM